MWNKLSVTEKKTRMNSHFWFYVGFFFYFSEWKKIETKIEHLHNIKYKFFLDVIDIIEDKENWKTQIKIHKNL